MRRYVVDESSMNGSSYEISGGWECMWGVRVYIHTHTVRGVLGCEPRGRVETLEGPKF